MSLSKINPGNQPDRIYLSSDDAVDVPVVRTFSIDDNSYSSFTINLQQPVLRCDGVQLASLVQPNVPADGPCIPDYQAARIGFMYYKQSSPNVAPSGADLQVLYFVSSLEQVQQSPNAVPNYANRYFSSYADFVVALNDVATFIANGPAGGPDLEFYYDSTLRKIAFRGLDNTKYYMPAGYSDPLVVAYINQFCSDLQPIPQGYTLNQRVGFNNQQYSFNDQKLGGTAATDFIYPFGYPNLVRTGSITLRTNFNYQSSINSKDNRDVLAVVPVSVPFLGVNNFQYNLNHYLTNVPETIQQITIRMLDDQGQPYPVGNNVQTTIEILATYGGARVVQ